MGWIQNASDSVQEKSTYPTILAVCITLTIIMTTTVALRGYVRGYMLKTIGWDDWVILSSAVSVLQELIVLLIDEFRFAALCIMDWLLVVSYHPSTCLLCTDLYRNEMGTRTWCWRSSEGEYQQICYRKWCSSQEVLDRSLTFLDQFCW